MLKYNKKNINNAKIMRKEMTPWEGKLWHLYLKNMKPKIYRQRLIDSYIVDFYCPKARLAIELDGSQHREIDNIKYDEVRTQKLLKLNIEVLRFSNIDIDKHLREVVEYIIRKIDERCK